MTKSGALSKLLKDTTAGEVFALWLLVIPTLLTTWITIVEKLGLSKGLLQIAIWVLVVVYVLSFIVAFRLIGGLQRHRDLRDRVSSYLNRRKGLASYERLASKSEIGATVDELQELPSIFDTTFRMATLKPGKPGLALNELKEA